MAHAARWGKVFRMAVLGTSLSAVGAGDACAPAPAGPFADLIITNARIWKVDASRPRAEALAVLGDRIIAVGSVSEAGAYRGPATSVIDARGRVVMPGFNDAHIHLVEGGMQLDNVDLKNAFARRYFADRSPLGKWANIGGETDRREIVGVVKDIKLRSIRQEVRPAMYVALTQRRDPMWGGYIARGNVNRSMIETALRRIDPKLRPDDVRTLDEHLSRGILQERMMGTLSGFFGALSLLLVSVGIYAVMAFQVARRQKEIGIRMALGARPLQVTGMMIIETALPVGIGVSAGIAGALALTRVAEKMLFGVKPTDPVTFAGACTVLVALALTAAYLPSRVAARLSPVETLRCE